MSDVVAVIRSSGGVARTGQLLAAGLTAGAIRHAWTVGRIARAHKGVYALPGLPPAVLDALRVGGRLCCASAAALHGIWKPDEALHVTVPANAARLRDPVAARVGLSATPAVKLHWNECVASDRLTAEGPDSVRQVFKCFDFVEAFAVLESALRNGVVSRRWVADEFPGASRRHQALLRRADGVAESGTESLLKVELLRTALPFRQQVSVRGVGRVGFVIGDRLIVEVDSKSHHADLHRDRHRDGAGSIAGFRTLRFMYAQVRYERDWVLRAILAAYVRGDHL